MRVLITGAGGFVGQHLIEHLAEQGIYELFGTTFYEESRFNNLVNLGATLRQVNLTDEDAVRSVLNDFKPDQIYHLAAQSFVPESFANPWNTLENNIRSQLNIMHQMVQMDSGARILVVGTGEVYGPVSPDDIPINENQPFCPPSPYSVSKIAQDMLGLQYFLSHNVAAIRVRPFNQIGPGQGKQFVAPAFASQIASIEAGLAEPTIFVGNLNAKRDFTDVRDMVKAYSMVMKLGEPGAVYNIGSGVAHSIQELLDTLLHHSDAPIEVKQDPSRMRPVDVPIIVCDPSRIRATTGWTTEVPFDTTLIDVLNDWRARIAAS